MMVERKAITATHAISPVDTTAYEAAKLLGAADAALRLPTPF